MGFGKKETVRTTMTYVIDIDDTILFSVMEDCEYKLVSEDKEMVQKINELYDNGDTIIIHTGRHWNHLRQTIDQLDSIGLKRHTIICGKPPANFYVDDKGLRPDEFLRR